MKCDKPEDLPVLASGEESWKLLTSPEYHSYGKVHVHRFLTGECSRTKYKEDQTRKLNPLTE